MKNSNRTSLLYYRNCIPVILILFLCSCGSWEVPAACVGEWKTDNTKIMVRTQPRWMKFKFTADTAAVCLKINSDKTVSGNIGTAAVVNGKLKKNWGLPSSHTGVAYIVECGSIGKISDADPVAAKEVELWLSPLNGNNRMNAELRFTEHGAVFPMADLKFTKMEK